MNQFEQDLVELLPRLRRFARSLTRDAVEADDLCQIVIEKALKNQKRKRSDSRLDGWIFMIARNQWLDMQRRSRRMDGKVVSIDGEDRPDLLADAVPADDPLVAMTIHKAIGELPNEQKEAAALVWVEGYSYKEAAGMLDIPIGTLTSRLSRARAWLVTQMEAV